MSHYYYSNKTIILSIIGAIVAVSLIMASSISYPAFALTRYFNCVIREANRMENLLWMTPTYVMIKSSRTVAAIAATVVV